MSLSLKTSAKIGKGLVWLRYMMPLICLIAMVVMCSLPLFSLNNRDDEENKKQSVFTLAAVSAENSKSTLQKKGLEDVDYALARSLRSGTAVFWVVICVGAFLTLWFTLFSVPALLMKPESPQANLCKIRFSLFIPGKPVENLLPWLSFVPLCLPYYVIGRFERYYVAQAVTEGKPDFFEYSVRVSGVNPLWISAGLALFSLILFVAVHDLTARYKMDMYRHYEPEQVKKFSRR